MNTQTQENTQNPLLKYAGKVITVEVSLVKIAEQLKASFKEDFAHAAMLTETIMDIALSAKNVHLLHNNLNGFVNAIDFEVGQVVSCSDKGYKYLEPATQSKYAEIGECEILEVDMTKTDNVKVKYNKGTDLLGQSGVDLQTTWTKHSNLSAIK